MRLIYADDAIYELKREFPADDFGKIIRCISRTLTADVVERKDLDKITEVHEKIGYEKGYRDGYAQSIEDAIEVVGINTWAGSRITKLQSAQDRIVGKETEDGER